MSFQSKNDKTTPMIWAIIFLLLGSGIAWVLGDHLFYAALVGAGLGWWFGTDNLASRLANGLGGIGRAKFWALYWMSLDALLGGAIGFVVGAFGLIIDIYALKSVSLLWALFFAIYALVSVLESLELIEEIDGAHYWVIAGTIFGPIIGHAIGATVIYEGRVYYDVGVHLKGSEHGRP